jgi:hypothetical protein
MLPKNWQEFVKQCGHPNSCEEGECHDIEECNKRRNDLIEAKKSKPKVASLTCFSIP